MRMGVLRYRAELGEADVRIAWKSMPDNVVMLDILRDWICELEYIYAVKHKQVFERKQKESGDDDAV